MCFKECVSIGSDLATIGTFIAIPIVSYLAYVQIYKQMQEKWLSSIRDYGALIIKNFEKLYALHGRYHDFDQYSEIYIGKKEMTQGERQTILDGINTNIIESKAEIMSAIYHFRHNFPENSQDFKNIENELNELKTASDIVIDKDTNKLTTRKLTEFVKAEEDFSKTFNLFLNITWHKITDSWFLMKK
jgi:hypothetical protein